MIAYGEQAAGRGLKAIVAGAGGAAHLPGMLASVTPLPVVGVPVPLKYLDGMDSLLSIVQMPAGVPVATVSVGGAATPGCWLPASSPPTTRSCSAGCASSSRSSTTRPPRRASGCATRSGLRGRLRIRQVTDKRLQGTEGTPMTACHGLPRPARGAAALSSRSSTGTTTCPGRCANRSRYDLDAARHRAPTSPPTCTPTCPRLRAGGVGAQFWSVWVASPTGRAAVTATLEQIDCVQTA